MKRLCIVWILAIMAGCAAVQADVVGISGPPHATWGTTITVTVSVANPGTVATARQKLDIAMRRGSPNRARANSPEGRTPRRSAPWQTLSSIEIRPIWQGASVNVDFPVVLPAAPDKLGNMDGNFEIALLEPAGSEPTKPACPAYGVRIETRDAQGMIGGVYVPRNNDLRAANSDPAQRPIWESMAYLTGLSGALARKPIGADKFREYFTQYAGVAGTVSTTPGERSGGSLMRLTRGDLAPVGPRRVIRMWNDGTVIESPISACKTILAGGRMVFIFAKPSAADSGTAKFEIPLRTGEYVKALTRTTLATGVSRAVRFTTANRTLSFELPWVTGENDELGMDNLRSPEAYITVECISPIQTWE